MQHGVGRAENPGLKIVIFWKARLARYPVFNKPFLPVGFLFDRFLDPGIDRGCAVDVRGGAGRYSLCLQEERHGHLGRAEAVADLLFKFLELRGESVG